MGVVAFSKGGIDRVAFTVTGQGYTGQNPLQATAMTYNARTDVYEYWVPLDGSDFATNGPFTVQAVVYGKDGGSRSLETLPLVVNATGSLAQPKAWVSPTGNDATGAVNNRSLPFLTVGGAISKIQAANGGRSDGAIISLFSGTYNLGSGTVSTTDEWLTITRDSGATKDNTIITASGTVRSTKLLKVDGVTVKSQGSAKYIFETGAPTNLWLGNGTIAGSGQWVTGSNPVHYLSGNLYATDVYVHDVDYGFYYIPFVRNCTVENVGNDPYVNTQFMVNSTSININNGTTGWHSDAYQTHTTGVPAPSNRIIYNYRAVNVHYEGMFMRSDAGLATNNAFVNVFVELRSPANLNESNAYAFMAASINQSWDHLLFWHCTLPIGHTEVTGTLTNASFLGNVFNQFIDSQQTTPAGNPVITYASSGNTGNNEFLYNHFLYVNGETSTCVKNERFVQSNWPCPQWYAKKPDSHASGSATAGDGVLDLSDPASSSFGAPVAGSVLVNRIPFATVPADLYGNARAGNPDVGAVELSSDGNPPPPPPPPSLSTPAGFQLNL